MALCVAVLAQSPPPPPQQGYPPQQQGYPAQQQGYPPPQQGYPPQPQGYPQQQAPLLGPQQLDDLVQRIALYPDPLLAQVMTGSTYWSEIADAATWANQHAYLHGDELSRAMYEDNLQFDPSVMALIPFPSVLDMMARDPGWTQALGNAVLSQRADVMDAVQRMRQKAMDAGFLQSNAQDRVVVVGPADIEILPVNPGYVYVPYYNPGVVFVAPRPGFFAGVGITFGPGIYVGAFAPFGWAGPAFGWRTHDILIDHRPWARTWVNRGGYVHSYAVPFARPAGPRVERHAEPRRDRR
ncbi:MAG TPA: DUF3300 domain-containing protein [Bryobacteraceae bacterium]|nr:DUF3300 domain-containing protein [Bryobacteraceae bacterium]